MLILVVTALAGCGTSPATRFITLDVRSPSSKVTHRAATPSPISVGQVTLPPSLDRPELVRQIGRNRLAVDEFVQWAGPLDVMVRRTLALDLAARLPRGMVILPGQPKPAGPQRVLVVAIEAFWASQAHGVVLQAHWSLVQSQVNGSANTSAPGRAADIKVAAATAEPGDIAGAMSEALGRLADQIAKRAKRATDKHG